MKKTNTLIKCPQKQCGFLINGGCRNCDECGCKPDYIDENCDRCLNCARKEGFLRWDVHGALIIEVSKEMEQKLKKEIKKMESILNKAHEKKVKRYLKPQTQAKKLAKQQPDFIAKART